MKQYLTLGLLTSFLFTSCSINWNNENDKKISDLEKKVAETISTGSINPTIETKTETPIKNTQTWSFTEKTETKPKVPTIAFDYAKYLESGYSIETEEDIDINGDGKTEKLISYAIPSKDRWELRIYEEVNGEWKIIKKDGERKGNSETNPVLLEVHDFGNDGKTEVVVAKIKGAVLDSPNKLNRYYVFGFIDGKYEDYATPRGYLHPEWFPLSADQNLAPKIQGDQIIETYFHNEIENPEAPRSDQKRVVTTITVIQNYINGSFLGNTKMKIDEEPIGEVFKSNTFSNAKLGIQFLHSCGGGLITKGREPLKDTENGKTLEILTAKHDYCGNLTIEKLENMPKTISTSGWDFSISDTKQVTFGKKTYSNYGNGDMGGWSEMYMAKIGNAYYRFSFYNGLKYFGEENDDGSLLYKEKDIERFKKEVLSSVTSF